MPFLVDGDNLLGHWRGRARSDRERHILAAQLARFAATQRRRVVVVFDGASGPSGPDVICAGPDRSADEVILERVRAEADPHGWTVVTSDRSLSDRCRWLGAKAERADVFRKRLERESSTEKPEREPDVDGWLETFGDG